MSQTERVNCEHYDARCSECEAEHVIVAGAEHEPGDTFMYAHTSGRLACGAYAEHEVLRELTGFTPPE